VAVIRLSLPGWADHDSQPAQGRASADRSYEIVCGRGILAGIGKRLVTAGARRAVVISDATISATHGRRVAESLAAEGIRVVELTVPSGEASKSVSQAGRLWAALAENAVDRGTHVVAVGGGVVGDLAGFVAATFARGIPVWQVPTTLVAQVDSAIGGKTGLNLDCGKNLVGAFWQPSGVFSDIDALATLPRREYVSGLAEVVKYGMIFDPEFFAWLEANAAGLVAREPGPLEHAVERSATLKAAVVEQDEREITGARAALNYGHTFAHAFETAAGYGRLLHGEAVAIGMNCAARLAAAVGRIPAEIVGRQADLLTALDLPVSLAGAGPLDPSTLLAIMGRDKKSLGGRLRFVLPNRIGAVELVGDIDESSVRRALVG
jgi:3-dehydroquinate synthase